MFYYFYIERWRATNLQYNVFYRGEKIGRLFYLNREQALGRQPLSKVFVKWFGASESRTLHTDSREALLESYLSAINPSV